MPSLNAMTSGETILINQPFVFALNDQELEVNGIENSLILAA